MTTTVSRTFREQLNQMNTSELIARKLRDPKTPLSLEERIALLVGCIKLGEEQVAKVQRENIQRPVIIIGNTGSGKSTFINYLGECDLEYIDPKAVGINQLSDIVIVKHSSRKKEIMKIGHTKLSETFIPDIASVDGRVYCDCPGFGDNRGVEINVANIVNTRRVVHTSQRVRLIVLINYHALLADKAQGLRNTIEVTKQLFGNQEVFKAHVDSILVGVTQIPERSRRQAAKPLKDLKTWFCDAQNMDPFEAEIINAFAQKLFIYHPLDEVNELYFSGGLQREQILSAIDSMNQITNPKRIFNMILTHEDAEELREICEGMSRKITESLNREEYDDANILLEFTYKIREVNHPHIEKLITGCKQTVVDHFSGLIRRIDIELGKNHQGLTPEAERLFGIVTSGISSFGEEDVRYFEEKIGIGELKERYAVHNKRIQFFQEESRLKAMERDFISRCMANDFEKAEKLIEEMEKRVQRLNESFADVGFSCQIDLSSLYHTLQEAQSRYDSLQRKEEEYRLERERWAEQAAQLGQSGGEENGVFCPTPNKVKFK